MIMTVKVMIPDGIYAERSVEVYNMAKGLKEVIPILEAIPDNLNGKSYLDWTETVVTFEDRPWSRD
jgi:hypothetical protein